jgi:prevent-host-death family protein
VRSYTISEARRNFASIIEQAEAGEQVLVTRHGKAVVRIEPVEREIPPPGFLAQEGWSIQLASDFDAIPPGFDDYR